ncbi:hypothetical protein F2P56_032317 [Juglans regia]|uniref:Omega-3 fatty acid desaturase, endoplasmic reticulum-like n=1 Tax=Juglans regia TaxID=51240 RepID=A0A833TY02_JUGRE|nr:hypothetical protein F2P56_032317 [Juglans regia]
MEKGGENANGFGHGIGHKDDDFDPSAPPPFRIAEIRAAIPKHCWIKNPWRSLSYVLRDFFMVFALAAAAIYLNTWIFWPLYWAAQGTMFWAIFVLGHDCGHGSFSNSTLLNSFMGHLLHSAILVPYNGWRISHRTHHQNHGNVENDESWVPLTEKLYKSLDQSTRKLRFTVPFPLFAYPFYLWSRSPGKEGSHFNPYSNLFAPNERKDVITSTLCWSLMAALLIYLSFAVGPIQMLKLYGVPHLIFVMWLDFVTYLHHHGYEQKLPWYRGKVLISCLYLSKTSEKTGSSYLFSVKHEIFCLSKHFKLNYIIYYPVDVRIFDRNGVIYEEGLQQLIVIMEFSITSTMISAPMLYTISSLKSHTTI